MLGKIVPKIFSGEKKLIFTESVCFFPSEGIEFKLPTSNAAMNWKPQDIIISLSFESVEGEEPRISNFLAEDNKLKFTLTNFANSLGVGTTTPIDFKIGNDAYYLLVYAQALTHKSNKEKQLLNMTVSMYSGSAL